MKQIMSAVALVLLATTAASAAEPSAVLDEAFSSIRARKMGVAARIVVLQPGDKEYFDKLYGEFQDALEGLNAQYSSLAYKYLERSSPLTMEEAQKAIRDYRDLEVKRLDLKDYYFEKFTKILDPGQLIRVFQLENKADALVRNEAAMQIDFLK